MPQPTPYVREGDFSDDEASSVAGRSSVLTAQLDAELDAIGTTLTEILANMAILQRDDTLLGNDTVHKDALDDTVLALITAVGVPRGDWLTATDYAAKDLMAEGGVTYINSVAHTSGVFATDLASGYWIALSASAAASLAYDNSTSGLAATNLQDAVDELDTLLDILKSGSAFYAADSGAADAYVATPSPAISFASGVKVRVRIANNNTTTSPTLNVSGTGAIAIKKYGDQAMVADDLEAGSIYTFVGDATDNTWELQSGVSNVTAFGASIMAAVTAVAARTLLDVPELGGDNDFLGTAKFQKTLYEKKGADIASANDLVLLTDGNSNDITGTTTVNGMTDGVLNERRHFKADGAFILKHNTAASSGFSSLYIVQGAADITTAAGDEWDTIYDGALWRVVNYDKASGEAVVGATSEDYIKLSDVKAANTHGGTFTSGAWQTRTLNTEDTDAGGHCTLSANQFTLAAGTYRISAVAPALAVDRHKAVLYNVTDAANEIIGSSVTTSSSDVVSGNSDMSGEFTIAASKVFEIRHQGAATQATNGFGQASNFAVSEVYTVVELWKVA